MPSSNPSLLFLLTLATNERGAHHPQASYSSLHLRPGRYHSQQQNQNNSLHCIPPNKKMLTSKAKLSEAKLKKREKIKTYPNTDRPPNVMTFQAATRAHMSVPRFHQQEDVGSVARARMRMRMRMRMHLAHRSSKRILIAPRGRGSATTPGANGISPSVSVAVAASVLVSI